MKNSDKQAFPNLETLGTQCSGLTKREYFAGLAMKGFLSQHNESHLIRGATDTEIKICAELSIKMADELLKQLEQNNSAKD